MDQVSILVVTFGALLALVLLIVAALVLPGRSFTQLLELIASIGSSVEANKQELQHLRTILLNGTATGLPSAPAEDTRTTPANPEL